MIHTVIHYTVEAAILCAWAALILAAATVCLIAAMEDTRCQHKDTYTDQYGEFCADPLCGEELVIW